MDASKSDNIEGSSTVVADVEGSGSSSATEAKVEDTSPRIEEVVKTDTKLDAGDDKLLFKQDEINELVITSERDDVEKNDIVDANENVKAPETVVVEPEDKSLEPSEPTSLVGKSISDDDQQTVVKATTVVQSPPLPKQSGELQKLHSLCTAIIDGQASTGQSSDNSILQLIVTDDMSSIRNSEVLTSLFIEYLHLLPPKVVSEVLSVLIAIVKKSVFHLESARGLLIPCINHLLAESTKHIKGTQKNSNLHPEAHSDSTVSLTRHFLREWVNLLIAHSCDVEELKSILKFSEHDPTLLNFIQQAHSRQRNRPPAFFAFPGTKGSMMSLPPFQKWPIQLGWSFSTWFFLEPKACAQPYLYNFKTGKSGLGYSAHFTGNCLVLTSIRVKGKGVQHCIAYEFPSYKWIHCAITYHNKWRASEIKVYINGQLSANIEMPWQVQTTEIFDKCFIGGSGTIASNDRSGELNCFCGQMSAIYLFNEGLSPAQICAIHRLGPSYMGQFKYSNESHVNLPPQITKALYEERLASTLFCLFTPVAVDSETLCIQLAPFRSSTSASAQNYFISAPHAALLGQTKAIITQPISSTLQSLGCARSLLPLLDVFASKGDSEAVLILIGFLCDLLESSPHWFANEIVQNNGFVTVACALASDARLLLSEKILDIFLNLTRTLLTTSSTIGDSMLLKHVLDNILSNPTLWIYADTKLQIKLYTYLANEFLHGTRHSINKYRVSNSTGSSSYVSYNPTSTAATAMSNHNYSTGGSAAEDQTKSGSFEPQSSVVTDLLFGEVRRVSTVLQSLHALKYYYWVVEEKGINPKARNYQLRPSREDIAIIRAQILLFTKELIVRAHNAPLDEVQGILNYLTSCVHPENLLDVLEILTASLLREHPNSMVQALDQKQGIKVLFSLIGSPSERVRIKALNLLGLFLAQCTHKKKHDIMDPDNLFMLLSDKLRAYKPMTFEVYNALMGIMVETDNLVGDTSATRDMSKRRIENSVVIKVIATLLHEERNHHTKAKSLDSSKQLDIAHDIRGMFLNDLWNLIVVSRENRRIILQMSVWQHWLINLIDSTVVGSQLVRDQVLAIFRVLLYHAIRYEYGGWRVWIDTLAIIHTKVSYDDFHHQLNPSEAGLVSQYYEDPKRREIGIQKQLNNDAKGSESKHAAEESHRISVENSPSVESKASVEIGENGESDEQVNGDQNPVVSSISGRIPRESSGIQMTDETGGVDEPDSKVEQIAQQLDEVDLDNDKTEVALPSPDSAKPDESIDSVDLAPSRAYRKLSLKKQSNQDAQTSEEMDSEQSCKEVTRQASLTSIPLEDMSTESVNLEDKSGTPKGYEPAASSLADEHGEVGEEEEGGEEGEEVKQTDRNIHEQSTDSETHNPHQQPKATASPAFRIPEFRWGTILVKLLNDLMFSIECDLYQWRCSAKSPNLDIPPFVPKCANSANSQAGSTTSAGPSINRTSSSSTSSSSASSMTAQIESVLQRPENQIYIINVVHFVSQLADNIIIASGGLLPLLADATGGSRCSATTENVSAKQSQATCEGLTMAQANSLLYRLINMVDVVIFAASHIKLSELEADKNTTSGGILRQCLRLACTVTVKNCLVVRSLNNKISAMGCGGSFNITAGDFPKDMFDSYHGCSLLSANGLFENSTFSLENSDLLANVEFSPHQTPNTSSMPSLLPFQSTPIKDANKLLQLIDILRIQACIYHDFSTESRQSQFLALSSLYFISVLMVSKYRDIIEPKQKSQQQKVKLESINEQQLPVQAASKASGATDETKSIAPAGFQNGSSLSNAESNLLTFGKLNPNAPGSQQSIAASSTTNSLTDMLTTKLENTLDTVCPLLKTIMCDFCSFLSKTLIGSHGQDLVNKEADRTFKRTNTSPVELVMLLCSQEWQNTLQKNAGLAFIELINEGRVLSHGMKDHIVRVAMEAEFILSRLRADDVSKHEHFNLACAETHSARLHEEVLINSLISSATRRDFMLYCKFRESVQNQRRKDYKLDVWEDDDRRRRRFVIDSWDDTHQTFYSSSNTNNNNNKNSSASTGSATRLDDGSSSGGNTTNNEKTDTKRILDLQQTIELGGIDDHCSPAGASSRLESDELHGLGLGKDDDCDEEEYDDENDDQGHNDSQSPDSDAEQHPHKIHSNLRSKDLESADSRQTQTGQQNIYGNSINKSLHNKDVEQGQHDINGASVGNHSSRAINSHVWDYDDCSSVNDFTGSVIFAAECSLVWSIYAIPGIFQLTTHELYFEPNQHISDAIELLKKEELLGGCEQQQDQQHQDESGNQQMSANKSDSSQIEALLSPSSQLYQISLRKLDLKVLRYCDFLTCNGKILLNDIRAIFSRHYLLQPHALEIFLAQRSSVMFAFSDFETVKRAIKYLPPVGVGIKYGIPQTRRASLMTPRQLFSASNMMQKWQRREIGNFQYLMFLNTIAGRTYQDLNQYPVFPWILTNYESEELDLNLPTNFRDLSKPVGALNNKRRAEFIERYQSWDNPKVPAFHYGTHYSTAAFTLNWLCRLRGSCNASYLALQDGKYEEDSRLFLSIGDSWVSSLIGGQQNVKELIPEFFYLPEMFHSNLGLPEVEFPPWAKTAEQFVRMHRLALESELVSCQLHQWVDLIFGYKQRGPEAINAVNTFYYLTYQGNVNLNMIQDPSLRDAIETQIKHFGQTPSQLTTEPHPPRFSALHVSPLIFSSSVDEINKVVKFPFNTSVVHISSCICNYIAQTSANSSGGIDSASPKSSPNQANANNPSSILTITSNNQYQIHKWMPNDQSGHPFTMDPQLDHQSSGGSSLSSSGAVRRHLIDVDDLCSGISLKLHSYNGGTMENILDEVQWPCAHYVVTLDGRYIIMGSFYDSSFRVFATESGKLYQVIYGHRGPITCIARSEGNAAADFYVATGGHDCSLLLWTWNEKYAQIEGNGVSAVHNPLPKLTISGHQTPVLSIVICAELGLIISGSKNLILVHTTLTGENLIEIDVILPAILDRSYFESRARHSTAEGIIQRPQVKDKQKTILEASMLGDGGGRSASSSLKAAAAAQGNSTSRSVSPTTSNDASERFAHLRELCRSDYYITNLQFARELGFIVCVALPPPRRKTKSNSIDDVSQRTTSLAALLMTFNLKGSLMNSTTIGQSVNCPRLGDVCVLQATKDGEHLVLNDSPTTLKIYRTFDLQPVYAYNTNDIPNRTVNNEDQNRVKSLALLDQKYILVGLENGKIIVYNADFKNLQ